MKPAAFVDVIAWNAVCLLCVNVASPRRTRFYQTVERLFKSAGATDDRGARLRGPIDSGRSRIR